MNRGPNANGCNYVKSSKDRVQCLLSRNGSLYHDQAGINMRRIMAAKRTPELVPLAHPLPITSVAIDFELGARSITIKARVRVTGQTGVEMEALTAAAVAGLTLIDMTKGTERGVYLERVRLLEKSGGRSGTWKRSAGT